MSEEQPAPEVPAFEEYPCSLGTVINHEAGSYHIRLPNGRVTGILANGEPSPEAVEADIASPAAAPQTAAQIYAAQQAPGFLDATTGIRLKCTDHAQARFTAQVTLIQVAMAAGVINSGTEQSFWDHADEEQTLSTADFLGLMLRYGMHCKAIFDQYAP